MTNRKTVRLISLRSVGYIVACSALGAAVWLSPAQTKAQPKTITFERNIVPVIKKYCIDCHSGNDASAGLSLDKYKTQAQMLAARDVWDKVADYVRTSHMPPKGMAQPAAKVRTQFVNDLSVLLNSTCKVRDPGRVTLRRLNRAEYNNTIRDLVGVNFSPADDFPSDDVGYGFDNIGDVLTISPLLMEKYLNAAEQVAEQAIVLNPDRTMKIPVGEMVMSSGVSSQNGECFFFSGGTASTVARLPKPGLYKLKMSAYGEQAGSEPPIMVVNVEGKPETTFEVRSVRGKPTDFEIPFSGSAGPNKISVAFRNDYYNPKDPAGKQDRNLILNAMQIVGPLSGDVGLPESHTRIMIAKPEAGKERDAAKQILSTFATRAYRRPVTDEELDRLLNLFDLSQKGRDPFEKSIQYGVQAVLVSPSFLFRVEADPNPTSKATRPLGGYELASRLSYFLWSSMPDDRLMKLAATGTLNKPAVLASEVKRMLADPRSAALADNFAEQWLQLRKLGNFHPNPEQFPAWDDTLRSSMLGETKQFFRYVVAQDRPVDDFLEAKYSFINQPLAQLYGIPGVTGDQLRKVSLVGTPRAGVLTQAAVLAITSNPTRTSPTKRGKWILENVLGTPPPPPPPGVGDLGDNNQVLDAKTLRKRMEQHRKNPSCASCHARIDPLGFGMENFDPIGRWRTKEAGAPLDSSGILPDGRKFKGPVELRTILLGQRKQFVQTLADRLLTYGLGRGLESYDKCSVDAIVTEAAKNQDRFSSLVTAIVQSDPFRKRRGESAK
jgi:Protein of unknown function (DUF1592)/Protein of unknown function (DUF1588)/Protein of unknown function (DUF1587)/Protein of unknown function (DUF1585)/Protein of unknown function (DUF1595)/Ca-dependent carbohydrate-binding module xylan-binding/Planctomycete cytochrome C